MAETSIGVSMQLRNNLRKMELYPKESYESIIKRLMGKTLIDYLETTEATK